jgi:hypothetical protein
MVAEQLSRPIDLTRLNPIASGLSRWIYETPDYPNILFKVNKTGNAAPPYPAF